MVTKIIEGGFGIVYFLKSISGVIPNCVMKMFKDEVLLWSRIGPLCQYSCRLLRSQLYEIQRATKLLLEF